LYGNDALKMFYSALEGASGKNAEYYELTHAAEGGVEAKVHRVVRRWISNIRQTDPECSQESAIKDLLDLVDTRLLVVRLPQNRPTTMGETGRSMPPPPDPETDEGGVRATARIFRNQLDMILSKIETKPGYLLTGKARGTSRAWMQATDFSGPKLHPAAAQRSDNRQQAIPSIQLPAGDDDGGGGSGASVPPTDAAHERIRVSASLSDSSLE